MLKKGSLLPSVTGAPDFGPVGTPHLSSRLPCDTGIPQAGEREGVLSDVSLWLLLQSLAPP